MIKSVYESPKLVDLNDAKALGAPACGPGGGASTQGSCVGPGNGDAGCSVGTAAAWGCNTTGNTASIACSAGTGVA